MIDEKLKNYIRYEIKKGRSKEEIRQALLNAGHKLENIEQHFNLIEEEIKKRGNPLLYLFIFFVLLSIFLGIFSVSLYTKQTSPSEYGKLVTESRKLCEEGRYDKAFKNLVNAVTLTDKNSRALGVLGYCYLKQNESLEAIPVLIQAIRRNPEEPLLFYRLGIAYCNLNNYNLGIANLKKSININPGYADFYQKLAECYSKAGNEQDAKKYLDLIKEITPINVTPLESLY